MYVCDEDIYSLYENGYSPSASDEYEHKENVRMLRKIISETLSKQEKAVVIHIYYEGYTQEQTAKIMGISQPTVNVYLKRALCKLRCKIDNCDL